MPAAIGAPASRLSTNISRTAPSGLVPLDPTKLAFTMAWAGFQIAIYDFPRPGEAGLKRPAGRDRAVLARRRAHLIFTAREANRRRLMLLDTETGRATTNQPVHARKCMSASYWIQ